MPQAKFSAAADFPEPLREGIGRLREELGVPAEFAPEVLAEAEQAAASVQLPQDDRTDLEFVTIDPEGAKDLDQAVHIAREGGGYVVHYAIADVAAFVRPGGALDVETHRRGATLYAPTLRTPLHPPRLSEDAASLLPDQVRSALLWEIHLDAAGEVVRAGLTRARVRSRAQLTYEGVQADLDSGQATEVMQLLREVGTLRQQIEIQRGGVSLEVPEQEVVPDAGGWKLAFRKTLPVEEWNAQISLLTGICAAKIMLDGGIGILRTLPPTQPRDIDRLRHIARGLKIEWPRAMGYPEFVRSLDASVPAHAAMLTACTRLFRGAGYEAFDGTAPEQPLHAALATPYAHVTAPLRRLVDRYGEEVCLALSAGRPVPQWVRDALPDLPAEMAAADARAKKYERGILDLVEALVLQPHLGETFIGVVVDADDKGGNVQIADPAVEVKVKGHVELGEEARVQLQDVDLITGQVRFEA